MIFSRNILSAILASFFIFVAITGVLMFVGIRLAFVEPLHIWLGLAFIVVSGLHLMKNWKTFSSYFAKKTTVLSMVSVGIIASLFIVVPMLLPHSSEVNPKQKIFTTVMNAPLSEVARFFNLDEEMMMKQLQDGSGIETIQKQSIAQIAQSNHKKSDEILQLVLNAPSAQ
ncbi:MAG: DUF4405 domain-containing protein [Sulfurospirillaceae bacterium]|nr:DUF4405 domain-containing protein [Sulfurospirillaceae bacterium]